jgi:hypothetical protein
MRALSAILVVGFTAVVLLVMVGDAVRGGDWPGWDEGWAIVVFPLGVPLAAAAGLALSPPGLLRATVGATLAIWTWGGVLFLLWYALG